MIGFLARNPVLSPLFVAVGGGVVGALGFGAYYVAKSPDVVVNKRIKDPWNDILPGHNTKLWSHNKDWWQSRASLPDPRSMFVGEERQTRSASGRLRAKAAELKAARTHDKEETFSH
ncbi:uncharacterized protein L969DRAFT_87006 [Mixia osmundae IAM 14324]|uniref:Uncharacterized protein n=1 Tax=Mixia osmundae (strain CBS 9802 / IAM 14324 / JCM 22182 / KY 12970) TaxID=764103 RepID=G7EA12_MIXOS|nr:uncharacterized protein L969DRAFT_87006 [Mixia osmundae IAM 14324]KEI40359.1 hypothetical protein L969DRAFT_87006 [Mixia osmundae IAM 14324]GAA99672.1 hypothetical protein E5Q_06375 [Mixia osmundae IAM 14324]